MASTWGLSWGNSWGNSWGAIRRAGGAFYPTRKEMAALLRQERRYRKEKRERERRQLDEDLTLSAAIERAYRKTIGLPEEDVTPLETIAEAFEATDTFDMESFLAHLRAGEDFAQFLSAYEQHTRRSGDNARRRRRKMKLLMLAA